jgi:hypothetical protein
VTLHAIPMPWSSPQFIIGLVHTRS